LEHSEVEIQKSMATASAGEMLTFIRHHEPLLEEAQALACFGFFVTSWHGLLRCALAQTNSQSRKRMIDSLLSVLQSLTFPMQELSTSSRTGFYSAHGIHNEASNAFASLEE
jgi:hypothetical protein